MKRQRQAQTQECLSLTPIEILEQTLSAINRIAPSSKADYLREELMSKYVSSETDSPLVRKNRAINKWLAQERENESTEDRLLGTSPEYNILPGVSRSSFEFQIRRFLSSIVGDVPPFESLFGGFSGGASTSRSRGKSFPGRKYIGKAHITSEARVLFDLMIEESPIWSRYFDSGDFSIEEVEGNVMFTVPKTALIDRVAAKEPDLNMYIQRGLGTIIRKCLKRRGIDLSDQSRNRSLAQLGSKYGHLATVDLSSASDSVTTELVASFLPPIWFATLDSVRCRKTFVDQQGGYWHKNYMFSSMGNGFTFELESLIFYALAKVTMKCVGEYGQVSVYGDDIIVPSSVYRSLETVLSFYGFSVNSKKSFYEGPFRESCGGHYYHGYDVSPFYIRKPITDLSDLILLLNNIRGWSCRDSIGVDLYDLWESLSKLVPDDLKGGHDISSRYVLCSPGKGKSRLVNPTIVFDDCEGHYLMWLDKTSRGNTTSEPTRSRGDMLTKSIYRIGRRPSYDLQYRCEHLFYEEVCPILS